MLRKVLGLHRAGEPDASDGLRMPQVQHLLLVSAASSAVGRWFDAHPPLERRIERLYGGKMPPLSLDDGREEPNGRAGGAR